MISTLIDVILPVFLVIGAGYVATRTGVFKDSQIDALIKFSQGFAIPCLLFQAISKLDLSAGFDPALMASFYGGAILCFIIGLIGARLLFNRDWEDSVAIAFCCLFSNSLLLGLPISERAYGADNLTGNYAIIAFHAPFCYGLGITAMEIARNRGKGGGRMIGAVLSAMFKNTLVLAIAAGFAVNLSGLSVPGTLDDALELIARTGLPVALFALGGLLVQYKPEGDTRTILFVCCVSLAVHPALVWAFGTSLSLQEDLFRSAVVTASVAPGFNAYIFANMYGRAKRVAASSVLTATGAAMVTVWFWLSVLG